MYRPRLKVATAVYEQFFNLRLLFEELFYWLKERGKLDMNGLVVGDLEDYFKFGLLRTLAYAGFKLGIQAYNTQPSAKGEVYNSRYSRYLGNPSKYKACDPELFETFKALLKRDTSIDCFIQRIEQSHLFPEGTVFFTDTLSFQDIPLVYREQHRLGWFSYSLTQLQDCELVFLDPVRGLEIKSISPYRSIEGSYYATLEEVNAFVKRGKSVVIHQVVAKKSVSDIRNDCLDRLRQATGHTEFIESICFNAGSLHLFFIIPAKEPEERLKQALNTYKSSQWKAFMLDGM